jgi:vancomycin resistance protein YoaR
MTINENEGTTPTRLMKRNQAYPIRRQVMFIIGMGLLLAVLILAAVILKYERDYTDKIHPGVSVAGVDLSGMTLGQAVVNLNANLTYERFGQLHFSNGQDNWVYTPEDLGFSYNPVEVANEAFAIGRGKDTLVNLGEQLKARNEGIDITPGIVYDQAKAYAVIQGLAAQTNIALVEPSISLDRTKVNVIAGQAGRTVDVLATLRNIEPFLLLQQSGNVPMVIKEQTPVSVNVEDTAQLAENILSQPFTINPADPSAGQGPWTIEPEALASLLTIEQKEVKGNRSYTLTVNRAALVAYITSIAPGLQKEPVNARMMFNDDTRQLELIASAVVGTSVDIEQSVDSVLEKMQGGEHQASLVMQTVDPAVKDTSQATELGITELVAETTSYFYGSDAARVQNIRTAAASFHGVMVGPGEVFSMAEYLTDISLDNGYAEAPIIVGDQTVDGVGGGICQVSTTVFRNAFYGGFPIVERHPHAYRVGYYEQQSNGWVDNNLAGLDATVYVPLVDFKFRNDTPYWLLMETYPTNNSLTWKFYSTGVGREVDWWTTGITNVITPPDPIYREDPTLPSGTIKQVDWAVNGASVEVYRTVKVNGEITLQDTIRTTYVAWPAGFTYGPGTEIP